MSNGAKSQAIDLVYQGLRLTLAIRDSRAIATCLSAMAGVAWVSVQLVRAACLCGTAQGILCSVAAGLRPADREAYDRSAPSQTKRSRVRPHVDCGALVELDADA